MDTINLNTIQVVVQKERNQYNEWSRLNALPYGSYVMIGKLQLLRRFETYVLSLTDDETITTLSNDDILHWLTQQVNTNRQEKNTLSEYSTQYAILYGNMAEATELKIIFAKRPKKKGE